MQFFFRSGQTWESLKELQQGDELLVRPATARLWLRRPRPPLPGLLNKIPRTIGGARIWCMEEGELKRWLPIMDGADPQARGWLEVVRGQYPDLLGGMSFRWEEVDGGWTRQLPGNIVFRLLKAR